MDDAASKAAWSKDPARQVGCLLVRPDKTVASEGYNGFPKGFPDDPEFLNDKTFKLNATIHAEVNAVLNCRDFDLTGYIAYVYPLHPCCACASVLVQKGVKHIVCVEGPSTGWDETFSHAKIVLEKTGVTLTSIPKDKWDWLVGRSTTPPKAQLTLVDRLKRGVTDRILSFFA